jgi:probable phosphoglycerate mutase
VRSAFTSDRSRARRSAALAGFPAAITTPLLREFDYGEYEGLTTQQIQTTRPDWEIYHDGCPGGESPDQVYTRAKAALQLAAGAPAPVVLFSHGHFLRALAVAWTDLHIQAAARLALDTGTLCLLRDGDHGRVLQTWNVPD